MLCRAGGSGLGQLRKGVCIWVAFLVALLFAPVPAVAAPPETPPTVTVGLLADYAPFQQWPAGGTPSGYDLDLFDEVAHSTGLRFAFRRYTDLDGLMQALRSGEVQVVSSIAVTPERLAALRFTRPYVVQQQAMLSRHAITSIADLPDLAGRTLSLVSGYASAHVALERFPLAPKKVYGTLTEAVRAVESGEADMVFEALPVLMSYVRSSPQLRLLRTYDFPIGQLRMATLPAQTALADRLDQALSLRTPAANAVLIDRWVKPYLQVAKDPAPTALPAGQGPLRIGFLPNDPGARPGTDGEPQGMSVDLLRAVLDRAGLQAGRFVGLGLRQGIEALRAGDIDLMLGLTETEQRRESLRFVGPYASNPVAVVSRQQAPVSRLNDETGPVSMVKDYFAYSYLRYQHPELDLRLCEQSSGCLDLLERGDVQALLYPMQGLQERLTLRGSGLVISGVVSGMMDEENFALAPHLAALAPALRDALDAALINDLPGLLRLRAERAQQSGIPWVHLRPWLFGAAAILLALGVFVVWHLRRLRQEIRKKQTAREQAESYLAFMTHEVRNALQSVAGATVLLQDAEDQGQAKDRQFLLTLMTRAARSTMLLMDTLLDRHRWQQAGVQIERKPCSLVELSRQLVQDMQPAAAAKGLAMAFDGEAAERGEFLVDGTRVQQVLRNLVINAIKFTPRGSVLITLTTASSSRGAAWRKIRLSVRDSGRGMNADELTKLFTPFEARAGDRPGTGLGLALCREIAEGMEGTVNAQSKPGEGSEFAFLFDAEQAQHGHSVREPIDCVLLVESSPVDAILLHRAWSEQAVKVEVAATVAEAVSRLQGEPRFDLVLCGLQFGDGGLADVLDALPKRGVPRPTVIAMGPGDAPAAIEDMRPLGVLGYCRKDANDAKAFVERVRRLYEAD